LRGHLTPGQELGRVVEEAGLGVEGNLCGVDVDHCFSAIWKML
jgi:hypothetical protein